MNEWGQASGCGQVWESETYEITTLLLLKKVDFIKFDCGAEIKVSSGFSNRQLKRPASGPTNQGALKKDIKQFYN